MNLPPSNKQNRARRSSSSGLAVRGWTTSDMSSCMDGLRKASDMRSVNASIKRYCTKAGFENFGFAIRRFAPDDRAENFISLLNFPPDWSKRYSVLSTNSAGSSDPVIRHVTSTLTPTSWDCRGRVAFTDPAIARSARGLLGSAGEHGLRAGLTIPISGPHIAWSFLVLTTSKSSSSNDVLPELPNAFLIAQSVMIALIRLKGFSAEKPIHLTDREKEIIRWCSIGKTSWEVAQILSISENTVGFHLSNAAKKLKTFGRTATCARAIAQSLVRL